MTLIDIEVELTGEPSAAAESDLVGSGCMICFSQAGDEHAPELQNLACCSVCVCKPCLRQYLEVNARKGRQHLRCPSPACRKQFRLGDVQRLVDEAAASRIEELWYEGGEEDAARCQFTQDCDGLVKVEQGLVGLVARCDTCARSSIVAWSSSLVPKFGDDESANDLAFRKWASIRQIKPCPSCGIVIEKNGGCNLMVCHCGHRWCWSCGLAAASHNSMMCKVIQVSEHPAWGPPTVQVITKPVGGLLAIAVAAAAAGVCVAVIIPAFVGFGVVAASSYTLTLVGVMNDGSKAQVTLARA